MFSFFKRFRGSKAAEGAPADAQAETPAEVQSEPAQQPAAVAETTPPPLEAAARVTPAAAPAPSAREPEASPPQQRPAADIPAPSPASAQPAVTPPTVAARPVTTDPAVAPSSAAQAAAPQVAYAPPTGQADDESVETVEIVPPPAPEPEAKKSWLSRLRSGLSKTSSNIAGIFVATRIDEDLYEELETALLMSDAGVEATEFLLESLREKVRTGRLTDAQQVKTALRGLLVDLLKPLEKSLVLGRAQPLVMMIAGVNGAGKTTSIGKLAKHLQRFNQSVLLAAGDTFRAAAREQLAIWGERNNVTVVSQESGDPAAVIFDAVGAARARKVDVLMADTAGRLPTQLHLMEELRKVKRVIGKALDGAPHEVLLVIDANTGQNALAQVKAFDDALGLTGLIVTKLDGTAKGGILAAIARQRPVPVYFIGVGEKVEDLQPFSAEEFADALLGA
ncbi:signal recognition particle-docking protein FtsY [Paraburkholderia kururiensis]|uniref:Signal recognition particle receptor FtsY n=1 Tax=Paraburkholderia kururiensis TaxID=984307 RepID=A0ABZ0WGQ7_9BURK|nr:signal recognition particle-docking protein FtsY [Paraburkholderia kururiensis]WQD76541.1 signal recognition particle-docking protein FtsY [Paraburkholderia kururiensis]